MGEWKIEAHKLADVETEKATQNRQKVELVQERAKKMMEKEQERVNKQKGLYNSAEGVAEHIEVKAKKQAKLSQMVTETFKKEPVLEAAKKEQREKAEEKAKAAAAKANEMKEKA